VPTLRASVLVWFGEVKALRPAGSTGNHRIQIRRRWAPGAAGAGALRLEALGGRGLEDLRDPLEDASDRIPENNHDGDQPDGHEGQNQGILSEPLARILAPEPSEQ
jgi:hypothetical protein